jgi:phosphatidylglycerophosphatase A
VNWKLWIAQGFGVGRIPVAPGTFGSVLGIGFLALLLSSGSWWVVIGGNVLAVVASVWFCGEAEKILGQKDPGSVVLDEIAAIPICFGWWMALQYAFFNDKTQSVIPVPSAESVIGWPTLVVFILFRVFDVWKPWPVRQSQQLRGGWGVTVDDLLAALYVNLTILFVFLLYVFSVGPK